METIDNSQPSSLSAGTRLALIQEQIQGQKILVTIASEELERVDAAEQATHVEAGQLALQAARDHLHLLRQYRNATRQEVHQQRNYPSSLRPYGTW